MNKFIGKKAEKATTKTVKKATEKKEAPKEVIKKGDEPEFVNCPKCGWQHQYGTKVCRFCGAKIGG